MALGKGKPKTKPKLLRGGEAPLPPLSGANAGGGREGAERRAAELEEATRFLPREGKLNARPIPPSYCFSFLPSSLQPLFLSLLWQQRRPCHFRAGWWPTTRGARFLTTLAAGGQQRRGCADRSSQRSTANNDDGALMRTGSTPLRRPLRMAGPCCCYPL
jgi:hypothetical protein